MITVIQGSNSGHVYDSESCADEGSINGMFEAHRLKFKVEVVKYMSPTRKL